MKIRSKSEDKILYGKQNCSSDSPFWRLAVLEGPLRAFSNCFHKSAKWICSVSINSRKQGLGGVCITVALLALVA